MIEFNNEKVERIERYIIAAFALALIIWTFFGSTLTWNGVEQPQWLAGIVGVTFMTLLVAVAYGAAWGLHWLINAGWKK